MKPPSRRTRAVAGGCVDRVFVFAFANPYPRVPRRCRRSRHHSELVAKRVRVRMVRIEMDPQIGQIGLFFKGKRSCQDENEEANLVLYCVVKPRTVYRYVRLRNCTAEQEQQPQSMDSLLHVGYRRCAAAVSHRSSSLERGKDAASAGTRNRSGQWFRSPS